MNNMELETDIEALDMEMGEITIHYCPVIPNPEGEPTAELKTADIEGTIYKIVDEEARTELENKVDKVAGKGLSEEDFTHALKNKLDGIEAGAEVNTVNSVAGKTGNVTLNKSDVGLGNVDNTSDMNKPVSTATQTALNGKVNNSTLNNYYTKTETDTALGNKVDKVQGKGLSTNDYDDTAKGIVDGVTTALSGKVDKKEGYGLSENDYTDEDKALVGTIEDKLDKTETAVNSNGLVIATPVTDTAPYIYRQTPVKESFKALMKKIVGASVVWNQLVFNGNFTSLDGWSKNATATWSVANNILTLSATSTTANNRISRALPLNSGYTTHYYLLSVTLKASTSLNCYCTLRPNADSFSPTSSTFSVSTSWITKTLIMQGVVGESGYPYIVIGAPQQSFEALDIKNVMVIDLTAMFGTTIADYVYTLETSQSGSGIAWLQSYGFFTEDYYAYKHNKLESGCVSAHKTYDGETLLTNTELSPITLRGLFKLSTDKLTVDGDEYNADGSVTRKCPEIDLGEFTWTFNDYGDNSYFQAELDEKGYASSLAQPYCISALYHWVNALDTSDANGDMACRIVNTKQLRIRNLAYNNPQTLKTAMSGVKLIFDLGTNTYTEQTTPFTETEIVGSTEEFIDYGVAQNTRDVAIPVGTDTDYYQEMKLPSLPTTSGNHNLIYNIATGFGWS